MAGHAQLKCVMTECSKTQIRLTRLIYTERQKSCTTILISILFQTLIAFENNELSMNGQVMSNRLYASVVKLSSLLWRNSQKMLKTLILTRNQISRISVESFAGCFMPV